MKTIIPKKIIIEINELSLMASATILYQINTDGVLSQQLSSASFLSAIGDFDIQGMVTNAINFAKTSEGLL